MELRNIVVPTDFSPDAGAALDVALDLARATGGRVMIVHVCHLPVPLSTSVGPFAPLVSGWLLADAEDALQQERARCSARGIDVDVACVEGEPRDEIVRWAAERHADVIVVGTHARPHQQTLWGSVAERVMRTASMPVLTVHTGCSGAAGERTSCA
jgi:nucleotide-binding universal stress UspA family protein